MPILVVVMVPSVVSELTSAVSALAVVGGGAVVGKAVHTPFCGIFSGDLFTVFVPKRFQNSLSLSKLSPTHYLSLSPHL